MWRERAREGGRRERGRGARGDNEWREVGRLGERGDRQEGGQTAAARADSGDGTVRRSRGLSSHGTRVSLFGSSESDSRSRYRFRGTVFGFREREISDRLIWILGIGLPGSVDAHLLGGRRRAAGPRQTAARRTDKKMEGVGERERGSERERGRGWGGGGWGGGRERERHVDR